MVAYRDRFVVVNGNRGLFAHRVLAPKGTIVMIHVHLRHEDTPIVRHLSWDGRPIQVVAKLERSIPSGNYGTWAHVRSRYKHVS